MSRAIGNNAAGGGGCRTSGRDARAVEGGGGRRGAWRRRADARPRAGLALAEDGGGGGSGEGLRGPSGVRPGAPGHRGAQRPPEVPAAVGDGGRLKCDEH
eukprot:5528567-Alexandrium_andersonii.AAC.1